MNIDNIVFKIGIIASILILAFTIKECYVKKQFDLENAVEMLGMIVLAIWFALAVDW